MFLTLVNQGCCLSHLLYSLFTYEYVANDTTVIGLSNNDEAAHGEANLSIWCINKNLFLNVVKIVDFRKSMPMPISVCINATDIVNCLKFLDIYIIDSLCGFVTAAFWLKRNNRDFSF